MAKKDVVLVECYSGVAGDMLLGAFVDLGISQDDLNSVLKHPDLPPANFNTVECSKNGIRAVNAGFDLPKEKAHRHLSDIVKIIDGFSISQIVKDHAIEVFELLGTAEAYVHQVPIEKIHFHEVGALDSIYDIVGNAWCFEEFSEMEFISTPLNLGGGRVWMEHGKLPVPAPAVSHLCQGMEVEFQPDIGELTTPTGAALIKYFTQQKKLDRSFKLKKTGVGAGDKDFDHPNIVRLHHMENLQDQSNQIVEIEANIDDMTPELLGGVLSKLMSQGALDVFFSPLTMKKNRPAIKLSILCNADEADDFIKTVFRETSTFGVRLAHKERHILDRHFEKISISGQEIAIKIGKHHGEITSVSAEYDDCVQASEILNLPTKEVYARAVEAARQITRGTS